MLSPSERQRAADAARRYPPDHGQDWCVINGSGRSWEYVLHPGAVL